MHRLVSIFVLGIALVAGPVEFAAADVSAEIRAGRGHRHGKLRQQHRSRRHHRHRGERIENVPELSPHSAAAAMMLLLGSVLLFEERRRLRVVIGSKA